MVGILLESVEGLGHSPFAADPAESWELLQAEKELVSCELLAACRLDADNAALLESEAAEEYALEMNCQRRQLLEARLREVTDAQDRLNENLYGRCTDCGVEIDGNRLAADPAISLHWLSAKHRERVQVRLPIRSSASQLTSRFTSVLPSVRVALFPSCE